MRFLAGLAIVSVAAALTVAGVRAQAPPGVDQAPVGDPACDAGSFPNFSAGPATLRQEFRPGAIGLAGLQLCVQAPADSRVVAFVRMGTAFSPGLILGSAAVDIDEASFSYVTLSFGNIRYTPPGEYVIEVHASAGVRWRAAPTGTDLYPRGRSTREDGLDFAFRTLWAVPPGLPSGIADQHIFRDPPCNAGEFAGGVSLVTPLRQEFVPAVNGLSAIDLCLRTTVANQPARVIVRSGTLVAPGPGLAEASAVVAAPGVQWVRFTFAQPVRLAPGWTYLIEVPESGTFQWRSTCPGGDVFCSGRVDPDLYPAGAGLGGRDFGFRTIGASVAVALALPGIAADR
jgi:hypothetical protein